MAKLDILDNLIKPWVTSKAKDFFGEENNFFINMVLKKLRKKDNPYKIIKKVSKVLDNEGESKSYGEDFVYKLWRMIIF